MRSPLKNKSLIVVLSAVFSLGLSVPVAGSAAGSVAAGHTTTAHPAGNSGCC